MVMARKSLGDYMLEKQYLTETQLGEARKAQQSTRGDLAKILVEMGIDGRKVYEAKAQEMGVQYANLSIFKPEPAAINAVPLHVAKRHNVMPLKKQDNILFVAMSDPGNCRRPTTCAWFRAALFGP